jgi:hypothetical protein
LHYQQIRQLTGHKSDRNPLTQVEVQISSGENTQHVMLTDKESKEEAIIQRNQRHAKQSLQTPFAANKTLASAIDPSNPLNNIKDIMEQLLIISILSIN